MDADHADVAWGDLKGAFDAFMGFSGGKGAGSGVAVTQGAKEELASDEEVGALAVDGYESASVMPTPPDNGGGGETLEEVLASNAAKAAKTEADPAIPPWRVKPAAPVPPPLMPTPKTKPLPTPSVVAAPTPTPTPTPRPSSAASGSRAPPEDPIMQHSTISMGLLANFETLTYARLSDA